MYKPFFAVVLVTLVTFAPLPAQQVSSGQDADRKATHATVLADDSTVLAAVSVGYGASPWRASYGSMLAQLKGSNYSRLGSGWWTTLDTIGAIEIGGIRIEAGSYYLGLRVDRDGAFHLLLFDSKQAMQQRLLPASTPLYTGAAKADLAAPLAFVEDAHKGAVAQLAIEIATDSKHPTQGTLKIRWGPHEATAPVKFELGAGTKAADGKK